MRRSIEPGDPIIWYVVSLPILVWSNLANRDRILSPMTEAKAKSEFNGTKTYVYWLISTPHAATYAGEARWLHPIGSPVPS